MIDCAEQRRHHIYITPEGRTCEEANPWANNCVVPKINPSFSTFPLLGPVFGTHNAFISVRFYIYIFLSSLVVVHMKIEVDAGTLYVLHFLILCFFGLIFRNITAIRVLTFTQMKILIKAKLELNHGLKRSLLIKSSITNLVNRYL